MSHGRADGGDHDDGDFDHPGNDDERGGLFPPVAEPDLRRIQLFVDADHVGNDERGVFRRTQIVFQVLGDALHPDVRAGLLHGVDDVCVDWTCSCYFRDLYFLIGFLMNRDESYFLSYFF